jgi:hypothetical protein
MTLQDFIHFIEVGGGKRFLRFVLPCLLLLGVGIVYGFRTWKNFYTPEAMDSAQLARNIATGKGYTTQFVRPLSIYLLQQKSQAKASSSSEASADPAQLKTAHPDLANAPVYPYVLAGLMKVAPFHYPINLKSSFWAYNGIFWRYQPDFMIWIFNLALFIALAVMSYFVANKLFDASVARLSAALILGSSLLWRFSDSGLSTMLLMLIFMALVWFIIKIEELAREAEPDTTQIFFWSAMVGVLTALGGLTRYGFGWTIIPIVIFLMLFSGPKKFLNALITFGLFAILLSPWIMRNIMVSSTPFGTAGFAIMDGTPIAGAFPLERALHPDFTEALMPSFYWHKLLVNVQPIFENDLLKLGGNWVSMLFFAGLLLGFNRPATRRLRYFLLMCLATFIVVQALGRTWISDESPEISTENMLVLAVPLVFIFGAAFFFILLDQMSLPIPQMRYVIIFAFALLCCLPLIFSIWFKSSPVQYPPYYPPDIQKEADWMADNEMMMSDVPWAVAWYGQRQCVWLTVDASDNFYALNDYIKPVRALYLTMQTMDDRLVSDCFRGPTDSWGHFVLGALTKNDIPKGFPLLHAPAGTAAISSGLFLTDADRWKIKSSDQ